MNTTTSSPFPKVVIIGAGFGGLKAAKSLAGKPVQVTLIDRNNYHLFQPLLYQVATSLVSTDAIAYPVRRILRGKPNLDFLLATVRSVDLAARTVHTFTGDVPYDALLLAVGGETNFFGLDSVAEHGFGLKTLDDANAIRNHLLKQFEQAITEPDPSIRQALLSFVIAGGGPTGVECAGAISELIRMSLLKDYPSIHQDEIKVILMEAADHLMGQMPANLGQFTVEKLTEKHVDIHLKAIVSRYDGFTVELKDGRRIPACTLIWAAGVRASHLLDSLHLEQDKMGRVKVTPNLNVADHPEVFLIGDAAALNDADGHPLPMVAPVAMQQADVAVRNILHQFAGQPLESFTYHDPGIMATIGRSQAVAVIGGRTFQGFIAWVLWLVVHIAQLIGFRNRLVVLTDWAWTYLFSEGSNRLIGPE